jgi:hypothetical protein
MNSALLQTSNKFKKPFHSETKQITIAQNIKGKWEEGGFIGNFHMIYMENQWISNSPNDDHGFEALREKQKVQLWLLSIRQSAQTNLREKV